MLSFSVDVNNNTNMNIKRNIFEKLFILILALSCVKVDGQSIKKKVRTSLKQSSLRGSSGRSSIVKGVAALKGDDPNISGVIHFEQIVSISFNKKLFNNSFY